MFNLQQIVIPVGTLGAQPDPGETLDDWLDYFSLQISTMRQVMPCKAFVRLSLDVATRALGEALPSYIDEADPLPLLMQAGADRYNLKIFLDRELADNTVRLE